MPGATVAGVDRRFLTRGWLVGHLLVVLAVLVCLRLGWWQWDRSQAADGDAQNLGYALLWPAFGAGFVYMWVRFLQLELQRDEADDRDLDEDLQELLADNDSASAGGRDDDRRAGAVAGADDAEPAAADHPERAGRAEKDSADSADTMRTVEDPGSTGDADSSEDADEDAASADDQTFVGLVEVTDEEDPELAAYNRALAAIAEEDRKRAR